MTLNIKRHETKWRLASVYKSGTKYERLDYCKTDYETRAEAIAAYNKDSEMFYWRDYLLVRPISEGA